MPAFIVSRYLDALTNNKLFAEAEFCYKNYWPYLAVVDINYSLYHNISLLNHSVGLLNTKICNFY